LLSGVHDQDPEQLAARKQQRRRSAVHVRVADGEVGRTVLGDGREQ